MSQRGPSNPYCDSGAAARMEHANPRSAFTSIFLHRGITTRNDVMTPVSIGVNCSLPEGYQIWKLDAVCLSLGNIFSASLTAVIDGRQ